MFSDDVTVAFSVFLYSITGCVRPDLNERSNEKNRSQRRLFWTLPRHPAELHESYSCCQHQLCGLRVHEKRLGNLLMMTEVEIGQKQTDLKKKEAKKTATCIPSVSSTSTILGEISLSRHSGLTVNWQSIYLMWAACFNFLSLWSQKVFIL